MDDKKKKFIMPKAEVVDFSNEDIITGSSLSYDSEHAEAGWNDGPYDTW